MGKRTFSLAALCFAGLALGGVATALIGQTLPPSDGFVMWPLVTMVTAVTAMLFIGREYILPKPLATKWMKSLLAIIGLVVVSEMLAYGLSLGLSFTLIPIRMTLIWFAFLWVGVNYLHRIHVAS